ncbi:hypothetical protein EVAR_36645_1 [Eumeta japonica]|uniref:Uncharacterized protein n=1 Tax=Eumeta variegata TaxID=151549 RepID=A0A4C1YQW3_EUMVA|nr:hypothetical protein EVAR_36645_1 [Eumeta japonica]
MAHVFSTRVYYVKLGHLLVHSQSSDDEQRLRQVSSLYRSSSKSSTVRGNQRHCTVFLSTISRAMISSACTPSLKSVPFVVEEFHRARKPAPLHCFLVHDQSNDD